MSAYTDKLKSFNALIPNYVIHHLKRDGNKYLCPICNKPLTYSEGVNHIECEYCHDKNGKKLIRGYLSLLMYSENLDYKTAFNRAEKELNELNPSTTDYATMDKRQIGIRYANAPSNILKIYDSDYNEKPLIFTDNLLITLLFAELYSVMADKTPNIIAISNTNYVYNAMSVLMKMKRNHTIKLFLIFENDKESHETQKHLINDLHKYDFLNYIVVDHNEIITHTDGVHTIQAYARKNKDSLKWQLKNIVSTFNARYEKPILTSETAKTDNLYIESNKTPKNAV